EIRVGGDLEIVAARTGAPLGTRRRELDSGRREGSQCLVARMQTGADTSPRDLQLLHLPVGLERGVQALVVDTRHDEVRVFRLEAKQLVANRAADEVRVETETAHELLDCRVHSAPASDAVEFPGREHQARGRTRPQPRLPALVRTRVDSGAV